MADDTLRVIITGNTAGLQNALRQANRQLGTLTQQATKTQAQVTSMSNRFNKLGQTVAKLGGGFIALHSAFRVLSFGVRQMVQFGHEMQAVKAVTQATTGQFKVMTNEARKLGATTMFTAKEAAQGLKYLAMAGFRSQ